MKLWITRLFLDLVTNTIGNLKINNIDWFEPISETYQT
jgi:hypothetical protein